MTERRVIALILLNLAAGTFCFLYVLWVIFTQSLDAQAMLNCLIATSGLMSCLLFSVWIRRRLKQ